MPSSIFEIIRNTISKEQFKDYVGAKYGVEFRRGNANAFCPFHAHDHRTPSLGIFTGKGGGAAFHCFACSSGGDIVRFTELKENLSPMQAAREVAQYFNIAFDFKDIAELSDEEKAKREAELERTQKVNEQRKEREARILARKSAQLKQRLSAISDGLNSALWGNEDRFSDELNRLFPSYLFGDFKNLCAPYLGYSYEHNSICVLHKNQAGETTNIKYRSKFKFENGKLSAERMPGKWIGEAYASTLPFPIAPFLMNDDEKVIICEGEKDALNLVGLGANALTLGGVTASWDAHKELLKDKIVYIWFDHDEAGYENAIKKANELAGTAKAVYIVCFYAISAGLAKGYDISDFIYENMHRLGRGDIYELITFSAFSLSNALIDDICEIYSNLKPKLENLKTGYKKIDWRDVTNAILARDKDGDPINIFRVKGELDDGEVESMLRFISRLKKGKGIEGLLRETLAKEYLLNSNSDKDINEACELVCKTFDFKQSHINQYRQTHISDMADSFNATISKLGWRLGEYQQRLYLWVGNHFLPLNTRYMEKFIKTEWMPLAYVDQKKRLEDNAIKIFNEIKNSALNIDAIREFDTRRVINLINGTVFISKRGKVTFKPGHSYKDGATNILEFNYDPNARAPKWQKFLNDVLPDTDDQKTLMEFVGYCFLPSHDFESFLFLYGKSGANGKSVILDVLQSFFGDDNVSGLQLQQFENHQLAGLANKILNIGAEIDKSGTDKGQLHFLKALVGATDKVQVNPKGKDGFTLLPKDKPKLAFAGNDKPKQGMDNGVFRRMLLLVFDTEVKDGRKIRNLSERLKDEKAGIFNMALAGLNRLMKQNKFTKSRRMLAEIDEYKDSVNPMRSFVRDALISDKNFYIPKKYLFEVYRHYVIDKGGKPLSNKSFFTTLKDELLLDGIRVKDGRKRMPYAKPALTDRPGCVFGLRFSDDFEFDTISLGGQQLVVSEMSQFVKDGANPDEDGSNE